MIGNLSNPDGRRKRSSPSDLPANKFSRTDSIKSELNIIGIDFGNYKSCVGVQTGTSPHLFADDKGVKYTPSVVAFIKGTLVPGLAVGVPAKKHPGANLSNTFTSFKDLIGITVDEFQLTELRENFTFKIVKDEQGYVYFEADNRTVSPTQVLSYLLMKLKDDAESSICSTVKDCILTIPKYFNDSQREAIKDAALMSELNPFLLENHVAIALAYGVDKENQIVAIIDFGYTNCYIYIIKSEKGLLSTVDEYGANIGGANFDIVIMKHLAEEFQNKNNIDPSQNRGVMMKLKEEADKAKIVLSTCFQVDVNISDKCFNNAGEIIFSYTLTKQKYEEKCDDLFKEFENVLQKIKISKDEIDSVILAGGMTKMPKVKSIIEAFFEKSPLETIDSNEVVALGAAMQGSVLAFEVMKIKLSLPLDIEVQTSKSADTSVMSLETTAMSLDTTATSVDTTTMLTEVSISTGNLKPDAFNQCYLYELQMALQELPTSITGCYRKINLDQSPAIGILSAKPLSNVNSFPVFTIMGTVSVNMLPDEKIIVLSTTEIEDIEYFHHFTFSTMYDCKEMTFLPNESNMSYYILPINKDKSIDWNSISYTRKHKLLKTLKIEHHLIKDTVLIEKMKKHNTKKKRYLQVVRVTDKTVLSKCDIMPKYEQYLNYFEHMYKTEIQDKKQKLIEVYTDEIIAQWIPIYNSIEDIKHIASKYKFEYTIEEICTLHPFSSNFFFKVAVLPIALFRLNSLLAATELKKIIESQLAVHLHEKQNWGFYDLARNDRKFKEYLTTFGLKNKVSEFKIQDVEKQGQKIINFTKNTELQNTAGPPPSIILQALTCKGNGDELNNSHLKFIGNSFLKYIVTVSSFFKNSSADEDKMTRIKSNMLQNSAICKYAEKINLTKFLIRKGFDEWVPPCFVRNDKLGQTETSTKRKSDTLKALIGAYLISSGFKTGLLFVHWMKLEFTEKEKKKSIEELINNWPLQYRYIPHEIPHKILKINDDFQIIETLIQYKFKNRNLLFEAMVHKSYKKKKNDISYERLEYLGDGVLDYIIARQLFEEGMELSVDWCTDSYGAITNNEYFGYLALKVGLYKFMKMGQDVAKSMRCFVEKMEKRESFIYFKKHGHLPPDEEFIDEEQLEMPKYLGDIIESLAGAIYIDSSCNLNTVWNVYYEMFEPMINFSKSNIVRCPITRLCQILKRNDVFTVFTSSQGIFSASVNLPNGTIVTGSGQNQKSAIKAVAKKALAVIKIGKLTF